jgi:trk system potassium uptake protein TrkA
VAGRNAVNDSVLVCGLGRFGASTAYALSRMGRSVLAVDRDPGTVQLWAGRLARVVEADTTNTDALEELGCADYPVAVVAIGTSVESSVLTAAALVDLGIGQIWAKALSEAHGKILERIGVGHVISYAQPDTRVSQHDILIVSGRTELVEKFAARP